MSIAALAAEGLWCPGATAPEPVDLAGVRNAGALLEAMRRRELEVLYVHRSALEPLGLPAELEVPGAGERRAPHPFAAEARHEGEGLSSRALAPSLECRGLELYIGAYQSGAGDPFERAADGRQLLEAALLFRDAFRSGERPRGWAFRQSAVQTGAKLMHAPWKRGKRARQLPREVLEVNPLPALDTFDGERTLGTRQVEVPYGSWQRAGRAAPRTKHVLAYDVNGQRLAACARLACGVGNPEARAGVNIDLKLPGYHLVSACERPHGERIPPLMTPGWHTTPRLAMADYLGIGVRVERSLVWPRHVPYLTPFYEAMRDAREQLLERGTPAAAIALAALKACYLQALGRLASARAAASADVFYRPHWYDAVIGQELAREYLRLHKLADEGVAVLAVYFDAIVLERAELEPPASLTVSSQLGKFKALGAPLPRREARAVLEAEGVAALVKAIRERGRIEQAGGAGAREDRAGAAANASPSVGRTADTYRPAHGGYPVPAYAG